MFSAMDKPAVVYAAINKVNGKRYIGVTSQKVEERVKQHARDALNWANQGAFGYAVRKYGADGFDWVVIREFATGREAVAEEKRLIHETRPDYNSTPGGDGYAPHNWTSERKKKFSAAMRGNSYALGYQHTEEAKERIRTANLPRMDKCLQALSLGSAANSKRVVCLNDGMIYDSASEAARAYSLGSSCVIEVCGRSQRRNTASGLVFRYYGDHHGGKEEALACKHRAQKNSVSGIKGVSPVPHTTNRWRALIRPAGTRHYLGSFPTIEEAHAAYLKAEAELR